MFSTAVFILIIALFKTSSGLETCRILPSDPSWPSENVWVAFNRSVDGQLVKTVPIASSCHDPTFNEEQCDSVRKNWRNPQFHLQSSSSIMDSIYLNKSCDPFDTRDTPCRIGSYVQYAVNVSSPHHVINTLNFVTRHNIRLVVKNTGHDYMGRSTAIGALSIWTHHLQDISFLPNYKSSYYTGPAFKAHAGVLGHELATEAHKNGLAVGVGQCPTVGFAGGYIQGGGHSALSSVYGLAADQALEYEVITTQGQFVRASLAENEDLYWALSGGGGTYGIVWSVIVKAHPDPPVTLASLNFTSEGISHETFMEALDLYQAITPQFNNAKISGTVSYSSTTFSAYPILAVHQTPEEVSHLLRPLIDSLQNLGVKYASDAVRYSSYLDAYNSIGFLLDIGVGNFIFGSRLLPRSLWDEQESLEHLQRTFREFVQGGADILEIVLHPTLEVADNPQNAVLPAWREASRLSLVTLPLIDGESLEDLRKDQERVTTEFGPKLRELGSGTYLNEADPNDPDWKETFYGPNYDRLLSIKDRWDPDQILYGKVSVGGDRWYENDEGRLCQV